MLTREELATIRKRMEKATPGPWKIERKELDGEPAKSASLDRLDPNRVINKIGPIEWSTYVEDSYVYSETWLLVSDEDAEFISHAREDIKHLLEHISELTDLLVHIRHYTDLARLYLHKSLTSNWRDADNAVTGRTSSYL